jgi:hypothetical protein
MAQREAARAIGSARRRQELAVGERLGAGSVEEAVDELLGPPRLGRAVDDRGAVGDVGLQLGRQLDRAKIVPRGVDVGRIDDAGVGGPGGELADDALDPGSSERTLARIASRSALGRRSSTPRV